MAAYPPLGDLTTNPGNVTREDLESRIAQLRAARADAWSLGAVRYNADVCFQAVTQGTTQGGRRIYFRVVNPQSLETMGFEVVGGTDDETFTITDEDGKTLVTLLVDGDGDGVTQVTVNKTYYPDIDYFFEIDCAAGTWAVVEAELDLRLLSIGIVPPASLPLPADGPILPAGGMMGATEWNQFFNDIEDDKEALELATNFYQLRWAAMYLETTGAWTDQDPKSYIHDVVGTLGGMRVVSFDLWACGTGGTVGATCTDGVTPTSSTVTPAATIHGRGRGTPNLSVAGTGSGPSIQLAISEATTTTTIQRVYAVLHVNPIWE